MSLWGLFLYIYCIVLASDEDRPTAFSPFAVGVSARVRRSSLPLNAHPEYRRPTPAHHAAIAEDASLLRPLLTAPPMQERTAVSLQAELEFGCQPLLDPGGGCGRQSWRPTRHRRKLSAPTAGRLYQVPESRDTAGDEGIGGDEDISGRNSSVWSCEGGGVESGRRVVRVQRYLSLQVAGYGLV
jgi:hypothetical protein